MSMSWCAPSFLSWVGNTHCYSPQGGDSRHIGIHARRQRPSPGWVRVGHKSSRSGVNGARTWLSMPRPKGCKDSAPRQRKKMTKGRTSLYRTLAKHGAKANWEWIPGCWIRPHRCEVIFTQAMGHHVVLGGGEKEVGAHAIRARDHPPHVQRLELRGLLAAHRAQGEQQLSALVHDKGAQARGSEAEDAEECGID